MINRSQKKLRNNSVTKIVLHKGLTKEKWKRLSLNEQLANIGSEVERAIRWRGKQNEEYADLANLRAIELFDLTLRVQKDYSKLKEVARAKELWLDFFIGGNQYNQTSDQWRRYFLGFNNAARRRT